MVQFILSQQAKLYEERLLRCIRDLPKQIQLHSAVLLQVLLQQPVMFVDANGPVGFAFVAFVPPKLKPIPNPASLA